MKERRTERNNQQKGRRVERNKYRNRGQYTDNTESQTKERVETRTK